MGFLALALFYFNIGMISDIKIIENKTKLTFTEKISSKKIEYIYLDSFKNHKNISSYKDSDHDFKFIESDILSEIGKNRYTYSISAEKLNLDKIFGLYIITVVYNNGDIEHNIAYDFNELYCIRAQYIFELCNNCNDKAREKALVNLMLKESMLRNSIELNILHDSLKYYGYIIKPFCKERINGRRESKFVCYGC